MGVNNAMEAQMSHKGTKQNDMGRNRNRLLDLIEEGDAEQRSRAWKDYMGHCASGAFSSCTWEQFQRDFLSALGMRSMRISAELMRRFLLKCEDEQIKLVVARRVMEFYAGLLLMSNNKQAITPQGEDAAVTIIVAASYIALVHDSHADYACQMVNVLNTMWRRRFWKDDASFPPVLREEMERAFSICQPESADAAAEPEVPNPAPHGEEPPQLAAAD